MQAHIDAEEALQSQRWNLDAGSLEVEQQPIRRDRCKSSMSNQLVARLVANEKGLLSLSRTPMICDLGVFGNYWAALF